MIKLLILDIDGVLTDGTKLYDLDGLVIGKRYCDRDFTAIKRFKSDGIKVCFLSGDIKVNKKIAEKRKIDFYYSRNSKGSIDKANFLLEFEKTYNCNRKEMAYIGDDIFDVSIMKEVGYAYCPKNSPEDVKEVSNWVIDRNSGDSIVARLYDYIKNKIDV